MVSFSYDEHTKSTLCLWNGKLVSKLPDDKNVDREAWVENCIKRQWNEDDVLFDSSSVWLGEKNTDTKNCDIFI